MASRDRVFEDVARAAGFDVRHDLDASALVFGEPPWMVPHSSGDEPRMARSMHKDTGAARFMVADFDFNYGEDVWRQTFCAMLLREPPPGLDEYLARMPLPAGVHCVRRGDCVYLYPDAFSSDWSPRLSRADMAACIRTLEALSLGHYGVASFALRAIRASVVWPIGRLVLYAFATSVWATWAYWFFDAPERDRPGMWVLGLALLAFHAIMFGIMRARSSAARAYAAKRNG